jgi:hypothetical protein
MVAYFERRTSRAAMWSRRIALFSALLFLVSGLAHRMGLLETPGFIWILAVVAGLALLGLVLAGIGFSRLWRFGDRGGRASAAAVLVGLLVLMPFLWAGWHFVTKPRLTGVATDTAAPPEFSVAPRLRSAGMNPIGPISEEEAALQAEHYPNVAGRRYSAPPDQVATAIDGLIESRGWTVLERRGDPLLSLQSTIELAAESLILGFPADVAIRITDEGTATFVDMRSVSRYGEHDLGANARRVTSFMNDLDTAMAVGAAQ